MKSIGNAVDPTYLIVGGIPSTEDMKKGQPFCGESGKIIRRELVRNGLNTKNCLLTNLIQNQTSDDRFIRRTVTDILLKEIVRLRPQYVLCTGSVSAKYLIGVDGPESNTRGNIHKSFCTPVAYEGDSFEDIYNLPVISMMTYDPEYIFKTQNDSSELGRIVEKQFRTDIKEFKNLPNNPELISLKSWGGYDV